MSYDKQLTVFSPEGHLLQVEYCFQAINAAGITAVAARGKDSAFIAIQKRVPSKLIDPKSVTSVYAIHPYVGCCFVGRQADGRTLIQIARFEAAEFRHKYGYYPSAQTISDRMAVRNQVYTQRSHVRCYCATLIFIGIDEDSETPRVFTVDPAGASVGFFATGLGAKSTNAKTIFEKVLRTSDCKKWTSEQTALHTLNTLQSALKANLKGSTVEVAQVSVKDRKFKILTEDQVEGLLETLAESDDYDASHL